MAACLDYDCYLTTSITTARRPGLENDQLYTGTHNRLLKVVVPPTLGYCRRRRTSRSRLPHGFAGAFARRAHATTVTLVALLKFIDNRVSVDLGKKLGRPGKRTRMVVHGG